MEARLLSSNVTSEAAVAVARNENVENEVTVTQPKRSLLGRIGTFPTVLGSFIVLKMFLFSFGRVGDNDIFWHLRNAKFLFAQHHFPSIDAYSFTVAGAPWLSHEWLSELIYYSAYAAAHLRGLLLVTACVSAITAAVMYFMAIRRGSDAFGAGIATMLGTTLMSVGNGPRMHHLGWLCFTIVFAILQDYRLRRSAALWVIPIVFCVWINLHGSWPYGLAIFGVIGLAGLVRTSPGRLIASPWSKSDIVRLTTTFFASVAALFINPFGYKLVWYPFDMLLHQKLNLQVVEEWRPFTFAGTTGIWVGVIIALLLVCTAFSDVRWRVDDLALTIFVLYCGLSHERMLLPAGIVLATIIAPFVTGFSSYDPQQERTKLNLTLIAAVLVTIAVMFPSEAKLQKQIDTKYPVHAVNYLREHGGGGRLLNEYDWGGYLEWTIPDQKVFIDSRTDIFEYAGVLRDYLDFILLRNPGQVLDKYKIDTILTVPSTHLTVWLDLQKNWKLVYHDSQSVIYTREGTR